MKAACRRPQIEILKNAPLVVGVALSQQELRMAVRLCPGGLDLVELRLDAFPESADDSALEVIRKMDCPVIITLRHPSEGGLARLRKNERVRRFIRAIGALGQKAFIDIELRKARELGGVIDHAKERGTGVILSFHDFKRTPPTDRLLAVAREAAATGADLVKIACTPGGAADLAGMLGFVVAWNRPAAGRIPFALMGMGPLGPASRLLFAQIGSALNYGFIRNPSAPGQWPARKLKEALVANRR